LVVSSTRWKVHKFGGSSLADAECIARVGNILAGTPGEKVGVVVSAMSGMTDQLIALVAMAERGDNAVTAALHDIGRRYTETTHKLVAGDGRVVLLDQWSQDATAIEGILESVAAEKIASQFTRDVIAGFGEIWSARLLAAHLQQELGADRAGTWVDAREVVKVTHGDLGPSVLWESSRAAFERIIAADFSGIAVITGFIAVD